ncbi:MAG: hypothetical protein NT099_07000 [Candidatus Saganbacteria bacterium]|nr:hypothetical protein [Candidatus Saganbacteria bacterium]
MSRDEMEQERVRVGEFGDEHIGGNKGQNIIASNIALFTRVFAGIHFVANLIIDNHALKAVIKG